MQYQTKPRQDLIDYLKTLVNQPFTAEDLVKYFHQTKRKISKATIYRTLDGLLEQNIIRKYYLNPPTIAYYQWIDPTLACDQHFHLVCNKCGRLIHLDCQIYQHWTEHLLKEHDFLVDEIQTVTYGWCASCRAEMKEQK